MNRIVHPVARMGVARIFMENIPDLTAEEAATKATLFIRACHSLGLEVGPAGAFGPQSEQANGLDALDMAADLIEQEWGRKPWLP